MRRSFLTHRRLRGLTGRVVLALLVSSFVYGGCSSSNSDSSTVHDSGGDRPTKRHHPRRRKHPAR